MSLVQGLVTVSDLNGYAKFAARQREEDLFQLLSGYYEMVGDVIESARGRVIKFLGDATLNLFTPEDADAGVRAMLRLQKEGDLYLAARGCPCRHDVRAHFGPVYLGEIGTRRDKRPDIFGTTVNTLVMLKAPGSAITPEAFRKLAPATRQLFKKHTPPVTYIPLAQPHRK